MARKYFYFSGTRKKMGQDGVKNITLEKVKTHVKTEKVSLSVDDGECYDEPICQDEEAAPVKHNFSKKAFAPFVVWVIVTVIFAVIGIIWALWVRDSEIWRKWGLNPLFASLCSILLFIIVSILLLLLASWGKTGLAWVVLVIAIFLPIVLWLFAIYGRGNDVAVVKSTTIRGPNGGEIKKTSVITDDGNVLQESALRAEKTIRGGFA